MENSDNEDDGGNLDNLEDLDEEQMDKLIQLQVWNSSSFKISDVRNVELWISDDSDVDCWWMKFRV